MKGKSKLVLLVSLFVVSALLIMVAGALAAPGDAPFTLVGVLSVSGTPEVYSVGGQTFVVDAATVCTDLTPTTVPCASLNGQLVEVAGYISTTDMLYYATSITEQAADTTFTYVGELTAYSDTSWTVGAYTFVITSTTSIPAFFSVGDMIEATYTVDGTTGDYVASAFVVQSSGGGTTYTHTGVLAAINGDTWTIDSYDFIVSGDILPPFFAVGDTFQVDFVIMDGNNIATQVTLISSGEDSQYTYQGELTAFTDTTWTVGDYTFLLGEAELPPFFAVGDIVEVTFKIVNGEYVAISLSVVETNVPDKNDSARCENRLKDHPGVMKLAEELNEDPATILQYFCAGFGLGEIKLAYSYAEGSAYTPAMLLALRASGLGWGEIKAMAAGMPVEDGDDDPEETQPQHQKHERRDEGQTDRQSNDPGSNAPDKDKSDSDSHGPDNNKGDNGHKPEKDKGGKNK